jgi:hypothetical protein
MMTVESQAREAIVKSHGIRTAATRPNLPIVALELSLKGEIES